MFSGQWSTFELEVSHSHRYEPDNDWHEQRIPPDAEIKYLKMLLRSKDSLFLGITFLDKKKKVLASIGWMDNEEIRNSRHNQIIEFEIGEGERIL